jgi:hypothetical protein
LDETTDRFGKNFLISSDIESRRMFKNSCASCYSYPENDGKLWSIAFLNYSGAITFSFYSANLIATLESSSIRRGYLLFFCFSYLNDYFIKYSSNKGVLIKHYTTVLIKHVFPKLYNPEWLGMKNIDYTNFCLVCGGYTLDVLSITGMEKSL